MVFSCISEDHEWRAEGADLAVLGARCKLSCLIGNQATQADKVPVAVLTCMSLKQAALLRHGQKHNEENVVRG